MDLGLEGKVALVTGASKGIGKAAAMEFAREGCRLVISARGKEELKEAAEEIRQARDSAEVLAVASDVTDSKDVENMITETTERFGHDSHTGQ